jgi:hypothetical protein
MAKKFKPPIKYTDRDFESIKESLIDYARKYYPNTANDFNEASFGSLMIDMVAYIGDVLSFYLDYQATESFLDSAMEYNNVVRLARQLGYKHDPQVTAYGAVSLFIKVPANPSGLGPDEKYLPVLRKNSRFKSESTTFLLMEDVNFNTSEVQALVSEVDGTTGNPTYYAVKAYGEVMSGDIGTYTFSVGEYQPFRRYELPVPSVAEILSVVDTEGNEYYEVDYLSQDVIYIGVNNRGTDKDLVPSILKPVSVPRRFIVEKTEEDTFLQFGEGSDTDEIIENDVSLDPSNVALKIHAKDYVSQASFDPNILVKNNSMGISPSNTTVTVIYRTNMSDTINVGVGSLANVVSLEMEYEDPATLSATELLNIKKSFEVTNETPIVGRVLTPEAEEIRIRAMESYASQNRAVTKQDYIAMTYSMPKKFGAIKRCKIMQDKKSFKRNLNLYVISEGLNGFLQTTNTKVKTNLKNWINEHKMLNDTIDIVNVNVLNLGISYELVKETESDNFEVKQNAILALSNLLSQTPDIGESFSITDVYNVLNEAEGVADVANVDITVKTGGIYSDYSIDIDQYMSPDGRFINIPHDAIWEIRFVEDDIKGVILE